MSICTYKHNFNQLVDTDSLSCYHNRKEFMLLVYLKRSEVLLHFLKVWGLLFNDSTSSTPGNLFLEVVLFFDYEL